jgi:hypothetical protein
LITPWTSAGAQPTEKVAMPGITEEEAQSWASELPIYGDTFRYFVLRKTSDEIGAPTAGSSTWMACTSIGAAE